MLEAQRHTPRRKPSARALWPFHEDEPWAVHDLVPRQRIELRLVVEPIEVEVMHRGSRRRVFMHQRERGARDLVRYAIPRADRLHQRRLAGPQLAGDGDDERRMGRAAEAPAPVAELALGHGQMSVVGERWDDWLLRRDVAHPPPRASSAALA